MEKKTSLYSCECVTRIKGRPLNIDYTLKIIWFGPGGRKGRNNAKNHHIRVICPQSARMRPEACLNQGCGTNSEILSKLSARGVNMRKQDLHKVLVNPFYAGKIKHKWVGVEPIDGRIEPAVTYKDFLKVQDIMSGRTGTYTQVKDKDNCPLCKHVMCLADGTPFTSYTKHKRTKTHMLSFDYYKCNKTGCKTNVSAKEMHEKYEALLYNYDMPEEVLSKFEDVAREMVMAFGEEAKSQSATLKKKLTSIETDIKNVKIRYATGKIDTDTFDTAIQEYSNRKDLVTLELEKWTKDLSNLESKVPEVIKIASSLGSMWVSSPLNVKRRIQDLVFPEGVFWDKENRIYRTHRKNAVFEVLDTLNEDFHKKTEEKNLSSVPLCG